MLALALLVFARTSGFVLGAPIFSRSVLPSRMKILLALGLAAALGPLALASARPLTDDAIAIDMAGEIAIGFAIGLVARILLAAFDLAGSLVGHQVGFALANDFDPEFESQTDVIGALHGNLAGALFLVLDGHHALLRGLADSFTAFPVGAALDTGALANTLHQAGGALFEVGARVAAPVSGAMLLTNLSLGFLNRLTPQLSIFSVGFPLTAGIGLCAILIQIPGTAATFTRELAAFMALLADLVGGG